jgi:transcriptional regulator with XRE-family HTH domain
MLSTSADIRMERGPMKLNIGAKIAELRKEKNVTQEQLASAVGVSIAAVSKWECSNTYPDIAILPAIASYFEVSIDALLDYKVQFNQLQQYRDQLREFVKVSDYQTGMSIAVEALKKYPNDFDLLMGMASLKLNEGTSGKCLDKKSTVAKAIEFFNRALAVRPTDAPTRKESIQQNIAFAYGSIGEYDKAISILEGVNVNGSFDPDIAFNMIEIGNITEAKSKLQNYLFSMAFGFAMVTNTLGKCFRETNKMEYVVELQSFHASFLTQFTHDTPNYCDFICSLSYLDLAKSQTEIGDIEGMWVSIEKSVHHAVRFDQKPSYALASVKFMDGLDGSVSNNSSWNACHGVIRRLKSDFSEFETQERLLNFMHQLEVSASDKREIGVWR